MRRALRLSNAAKTRLICIANREDRSRTIRGADTDVGLARRIDRTC